MGRGGGDGPDVVGFAADHLDPVVALMPSLAGPPATGWLVLQPGFDAEAAPRRWPTRGLLQRRVVALAPTCTWVPGERERGVEHTAIGVEHAGKRMAGAVEVPSRWSVRQDDVRGAVVAVPTDEDHGEVLRWLVEAAEALAVVPLTGEWRAVVHRHRRPGGR